MANGGEIEMKARANGEQGGGEVEAMLGNLKGWARLGPVTEISHGTVSSLLRTSARDPACKFSHRPSWSEKPGSGR